MSDIGERDWLCVFHKIGEKHLYERSIIPSAQLVRKSRCYKTSYKTKNERLKFLHRHVSLTQRFSLPLLNNFVFVSVSCLLAFKKLHHMCITQKKKKMKEKEKKRKIEWNEIKPSARRRGQHCSQNPKDKRVKPKTKTLPYPIFFFFDFQSLLYSHSNLHNTHTHSLFVSLITHFPFSSHFPFKTPLSIPPPFPSISAEFTTHDFCSFGSPTILFKLLKLVPFFFVLSLKPSKELRKWLQGLAEGSPTKQNLTRRRKKRKVGFLIWLIDWLIDSFKLLPF